MNIFVADHIGLIYLQEAFLKAGHTIYLNINRSFNHQYSDGTNLSSRYPGQIVWVEDKSQLDDAVSKVDFGIIYNCNSVGLVERCFKKHKKTLVYDKISSPYVLESDRIYAKSLDLGFDKYDVVSVSSFSEFKDLNLTKRYVLKARNENSKKLQSEFRTVVTKNNEELSEILQKDKYGHLKSGGAILEEYINGVEVCCGFYWDGSKIVANTVFINQEYKCVLDNNRSGVLGGESGTVIVPMEVGELPNKFKVAVKNLSKYLEINYPNFHGFIDFNTMIKGNKIYLLEFTVRAGIPTEYEIAHIVGDYAEFIRCVATGDVFKKKIKKGFYTIACMYPYGYPYSYGRLLYFKMKTPLPKTMIPVFYKYDGKDVYYYECDRCIAFCGFSKNDFEESRKNCYDALYKWDDNNLIYRNDIGCKFPEVWKALNNIK